MSSFADDEPQSWDVYLDGVWTSKILVSINGGSALEF